MEETLRAQQVCPVRTFTKLNNEAIDGLGVKRITEFPVDLFLAPGYYILLDWIIGLTFGTVTIDEDAESGEIVVVAIVVAVCTVFLLMATARLALRYKRRRALGFL